MVYHGCDAINGALQKTRARTHTHKETDRHRHAHRQTPNREKEERERREREKSKAHKHPPETPMLSQNMMSPMVPHKKINARIKKGKSRLMTSLAF